MRKMGSPRAYDECSWDALVGAVCSGGGVGHGDGVAGRAGGCGEGCGDGGEGGLVREPLGVTKNSTAY